MPNDSNLLSTIPVGPLGIIAMQSCTALGQRVDSYLSRWRSARNNAEKSTIAMATRKTLIWFIPSARVSVPGRQKENCLNLSEVKICIY